MNQYKNAIFDVRASSGIKKIKQTSINSLQDLVDKETPMKPNHLKGLRYSCGNCAMAFIRAKVRFVSNQYCDVCGQKIDWSGE